MAFREWLHTELRELAQNKLQELVCSRNSSDYHDAYARLSTALGYTQLSLSLCLELGGIVRELRQRSPVAMVKEVSNDHAVLKKGFQDAVRVSSTLEQHYQHAETMPWDQHVKREMDSLVSAGNALFHEIDECTCGLVLHGIYASKTADQVDRHANVLVELAEFVTPYALDRELDCHIRTSREDTSRNGKTELVFLDHYISALRLWCIVAQTICDIAIDDSIHLHADSSTYEPHPNPSNSRIQVSVCRVQKRLEAMLATHSCT